MGPTNLGVVVIALTTRATSPTSAKIRSTSRESPASPIRPTASGPSPRSVRIVSSVSATAATRQPSAASSRQRTRPRLRAPKTSSVGTIRAAGLSSDAGELRDDLVAVRPERFLLPLGHEVDVELVDPDRLQLLQLGS